MITCVAKACLNVTIRCAASSGSHRKRMSSKLLRRLMEDSALELLLIMAPLILEIFAALFNGLQPDSLAGQGSAHSLRPGHRCSGRPAHPAARPAAPRSLARRGGPRHPRLGGVFTKTLDDGVKQCSLAGAKQADLLGPVSSATKTGCSKVCRMNRHHVTWGCQCRERMSPHIYMQLRCH